MRNDRSTPINHGTVRSTQLTYNMERINTANIITTRYQRTLDKKKVDRIVANFDERVANEPKVSLRNGKYYVFDGQHTIAARKKLNGGKDLVILCKVFYDLSEKEEALLFATQTGHSSKPTSGITLRAKVIGNDPETLSFIKATEVVGLKPSFSDSKGKFRLRCINTAKNLFHKYGEAQYVNALRCVVDAWEGDPVSLRSEILITLCAFVNVYEGHFDRKKLSQKLQYVSPENIIRIYNGVNGEGGKKKSMQFVLDVYNHRNTIDPQPVRF